MKLFVNRKLNRALALCARVLPALLTRDYGASTFYTKGQINKAIANLKLPADYAPYAQAMFLPEDAYGLKTPTYAEARAAFQTHLPQKPVSGDFYESGIGMTYGGGTGP